MEQERNNIVLIGMPSAGKSTLGIVLAKILNYQFVDADLVIQNQCDKTLQKLIDACGPEGFIQVENEILRDIEAENSIIATGGSAVYSDEAMKHLAEIGRVVYLQISYEELVSRLHDLQERGVVLKGGIGPKSGRRAALGRCRGNHRDGAGQASYHDRRPGQAGHPRRAHYAGG